MAETSARDVVAEAFRAFGLDGLADWLYANIQESATQSEVYLQLRETPEYQARFPAMKELQKKAAAGGRGWTEAEYIQQENEYREILSRSGLPPEFYDSADDYAALMSNEVSPLEVQRRVDAARRDVLNTEPGVREQLASLYGITTQDLLAYALVPDRGSDYIQRVSTSAILAGMAQDQGLTGGFGASEWEQYAGMAINSEFSVQQMRESVATAAAIADTQSRLASLEGGSFTQADALDITIGQDAEKTMKSQQRAQREKARFSGSSGITGKAMGSGRTI
jgi:hypothetical protein